MTSTLPKTLLLAAFSLAALAAHAQAGPIVTHDKPSNTFVTAGESILSSARSLDPAADDIHFTPALTQLRSAVANLENMASNDSETLATADAKNVVFVLSACHIQYVNKVQSDCKTRVQHAIDEFNDTLHPRKH